MHKQQTSVTAKCEDCKAEIVEYVKRCDGLDAKTREDSLSVEIVGTSENFGVHVANAIKLSKGDEKILEIEDDNLEGDEEGDEEGDLDE